MYGLIDEKNEFIVYLDGELDHCKTELLREAVDNTLMTINSRRVVFDMSAVTFMDSSGVGFLLGRYKKLLANGCMASIRNPSPSINKLLEMSGIYQIIRKDN